MGRSLYSQNNLLAPMTGSEAQAELTTSETGGILQQDDSPHR